MSTYPTENRADFVEWCQAHVAVFSDNADQIGLTRAQAGDFAAMTIKAQSSLISQQEAEQAARAATQEAREDIFQLRAGAGDLVRIIRGRAESDKNPLSVYNLAQISPPAQKSVAPAPATPKNLSATLDASTGALVLRWKCAQPQGTRGAAYLVRRRLVSAPSLGQGETAFAFVGISGRKMFEDGELPTGIEEVEYTVQAVRGKREGAVSAILTVRMGAKNPAEPGERSIRALRSQNGRDVPLASKASVLVRR